MSVLRRRHAIHGQPAAMSFWRLGHAWGNFNGCLGGVWEPTAAPEDLRTWYRDRIRWVTILTSALIPSAKRGVASRTRKLISVADRRPLCLSNEMIDTR